MGVFTELYAIYDDKARKSRGVEREAQNTKEKMIRRISDLCTQYLDDPEDVLEFEVDDHLMKYMSTILLNEHLALKYEIRQIGGSNMYMAKQRVLDL